MDQRLKFEQGKQKELLFLFKTNNHFSRRKTAEFLEIHEEALKHWISEKYLLPERIFNKIINDNKNLEIYNNYLIKKLQKNWGQIKGGNSHISKIKDIKKYCKRIRNIKDKNRIVKDKIFIKNDVFNELIKDKINLKAILVICILTDGSVSNNRRISFYTKDENLREILYNIILKLSKYKPKIYKCKKCIYSIRVSDFNLVKNLRKLSPTFKKIPYKNQNKEDYYKEIQPSIKFLNGLDKKTVKWCIRFGFSTDGCISKSKKGKIYLSLACYHPILPKEWKEILNKNNIKVGIIRRKNSWCSFEGIKTSSINSIKEFHKIGGFVPKVKISSKSKYYKGMEKNQLLSEITGL